MPLLALFLGALLCLAPVAGAQKPGDDVEMLRVPHVFSDNMVLQRDTVVPVWGWATPGRTITVAFGSQSKSTVVPADGRWRVDLDPMPARDRPGRLNIRTGTAADSLKLAFGNVVVGDVYLAGGQSNMALRLQGSENGRAETASAGLPGVRFLDVGAILSPAGPRNDITGRWNVCSPATAGRFSAVAYFFARKIHVETGIPVGIITATRGNSRAESWISRETLRRSAEGRAYVDAWEEVQQGFDPKRAHQVFLEKLARYQAKVAELEAAGKEIDPRKLRRPTPTPEPRRHKAWPASLYNGMIAPLAPYALKGVIWYQGEQNARRNGFAYRVMLPALIDQWRHDFGNPELPFYIVQLPDWQRAREEPMESSIAETREAQLLTHRGDANTGLAVIIDTGEGGSTHPRNKQLPGERLARWALAGQYGKAVAFSGPLYRSMQVDGNRIALAFDHAESGLMVGRRTGAVKVEEADVPLRFFAIAGADRKFVWADAKIEGDEVVVWSDRVTEPVAVRYAWADNPSGCNLYNRDGLPASPFRTDDWPAVSEGVLEPWIATEPRD